jgi:hypothetical protein
MFHSGMNSEHEELNQNSYESDLLRVLIGYFHVSLIQQFSLTRHAKPFESLTQAEKDALSNDVVGAVITMARQATPELMRKFCAADAPQPKMGPIN